MEQTKGQKILRQVITEAWSNPTFKEQLMANPLEAIEGLTGVSLDVPSGKRIEVRDQTDESTVYINIPAEVDVDDIELTEDQLEIISGGGSLPSGVFQNTNDPLNPVVGG
jgi:hypothetical protein